MDGNTAVAASGEVRLLLAAALSQAADAVVLSDLDGTILYANAAFGALTGWPPAEAVGRDLTALWEPPLPAGEAARIRDALLAGRTHTWRGEVRHRDGTVRVAEGSLSPVCLEGRRVTHVLLVRRDVTHEVARERQLGEQDKLQAVGRLAGGVAHELNNLLTTIGGFSQFLLDSLDPRDPRRHDATEIRKAAERATDLVAQLLAVGRRQLVTPRRLDLNEMLQALVPRLAAAAGDACPVQLDLAPELGPVEIDPKQLEHALLALVHNAREASPNGGPLTIRTSAMTIDDGEPATWYGLRAGHYLSLSVADRGAGMSEEIRATAFEPFFTTKSGSHSGLGLSAVYGVVQQNGGQLDCCSAPGQGTTMTLILPCRAAGSRRPSRPATATILVVDDEPSVRNIVARSLRQAGYTALTAAGPAEARAVACDRDEPVDLLLTDVVMPGQRGDALAQELARRWPELGVIYISGYPETELPEAALRGPRRAYLPKPFSPGTLVDAVERLLHEPRRRASTTGGS